jgi:HemK-like putative methylase
MKINEFLFYIINKYGLYLRKYSLKSKRNYNFLRKSLINKILLILSYYFNKSKEEILISDILLNKDQKKDLEKVIKRVIVDKYPLEYILGKVKFGELKLIINEDCLVPRQETEELLFYSFDYLKNKYDFKKDRFLFLELGVGSGNIILNFFNFFKAFKGNIFIGTDVSFNAIKLANINFKLNFSNSNFNNNFFLINSDRFFFIDVYKLSRFLIINNLNLIIFSNPPYLNKKEIKKLYDPFISLYSKNKVNFYLYIFEFLIDLVSSYHLELYNLRIEKKLKIDVFLEIDKIAFKRLFNKKRNKFLRKIKIIQKNKFFKNVYYFVLEYRGYFFSINFYIV